MCDWVHAYVSLFPLIILEWHQEWVKIDYILPGFTNETESVSVSLSVAWLLQGYYELSLLEIKFILKSVDSEAEARTFLVALFKVDSSPASFDDLLADV